MSVKKLIVTGFPGAGKDEVVKGVVKRMGDKAKRVVTHTSRQPRPGETHGVDYYFVSKEEFETMIRKGEFVEHFVCGEDKEKGVIGNYMGTTHAELRESEETIKIWRIDPNRAAEEAKKKEPGTVVVYIGVESIEVLKQRAIKRGGDFDMDRFEARMRQEWQVWEENKENFYNHARVIINKEGELEEAINQVIELIN